MKVKVFTKNKNGKIEFTEKELKELLDDVYWEGYHDNSHYYWSSPSYPNWYDQDKWTITTSSSKTAITADNITLPNGSTAVNLSTDPDYGIGNNA